ncbi:hypothetical protein J2S53_002022 [Actinopolyspora lacussalsi]|nr:hypothetical protein [Actinopolyspora lacussalsi]
MRFLVSRMAAPWNRRIRRSRRGAIEGFVDHTVSIVLSLHVVELVMHECADTHSVGSGCYAATVMRSVIRP